MKCLANFFFFYKFETTHLDTRRGHKRMYTMYRNYLSIKEEGGQGR